MTVLTSDHLSKKCHELHAELERAIAREQEVQDEKTRLLAKLVQAQQEYGDRLAASDVDETARRRIRQELELDRIDEDLRALDSVLQSLPQTIERKRAAWLAQRNREAADAYQRMAKEMDAVMARALREPMDRLGRVLDEVRLIVAVYHSWRAITRDDVPRPAELILPAWDRPDVVRVTDLLRFIAVTKYGARLDVARA